MVGSDLGSRAAAIRGTWGNMSRRDVLSALLAEHGDTFAERAGITLTDKPSPLFRLLVLTSLLSANLDARLGLRAARACTEAGYTTAQHLAEATDDDRWQVLSDSKYLRKKQTARQLGDLAEQCLQRYGGDLRRLNGAHGAAPAIMQEAVQEAVQGFTGIGPVGAAIFCREAQTVWPSLRPYADERVLALAVARGLPDSAEQLASAAGTDDLSRVGAALVFADMADRAG